MPELKILVCGDVNGNFKLLYSKVNSIIKKKGSFEYLFCVGNFFGHNSEEWEDVKSGKITVPVTTYILGPNEICHEKFYTSADLAPNIVYLGRKGCLTGSFGLKIAYLSGLEQLERGESRNKDKFSIKSDLYFSKEDVCDLINSLESEGVIDILLTSQWPDGVTKYAVSVEDDMPESNKSRHGSALISYLAKTLKPRFHFSGVFGMYYERIPYRNHIILQEPSVHITRFIGLAALSKMFQQKHKWLYAVNIVPACCLTAKQLTDFAGPITNCPFDFINSSDFEKTENQFFYNTATSHTLKKRSREDNHHSQRKKLSIDSSQCWFCLSNSDVQKQLIVSIGSHCYLTLPKGVLVPDHVLIVPINHAVSSVELPDFVTKEVEKYKMSLAHYFYDKGKDVVFFERNYSSPHLQIQAVPVTQNLKTTIEDELFSAAKHYNLEFTQLSNFSQVQQVVPPKTPYFYLELMTAKSTEAKYLHIIKKKFPLQFGRSVLASSKILNVLDRIDWRKCQDSAEVEKNMTESMRKSFAPYDFT